MLKETAKEIRQELKKQLQVTAKQVSVTSKSGAVNVRIKDLSVPYTAVKAIATPHESIRRDEATNEILCGANTFVFVEFDRDAIQEAKKDYMEEAQAIIEKHKNERSGCGVDIAKKGSKRFIYFPNLQLGQSQLQVIDDNTGKQERPMIAHNDHAIAEALVIFHTQT